MLTILVQGFRVLLVAADCRVGGLNRDPILRPVSLAVKSPALAAGFFLEYVCIVGRAMLRMEVDRVDQGNGADGGDGRKERSREDHFMAPVTCDISQ